ncbi:MAG TPA: hypothetical protein VJA86_00210 [Candidatus Nanoarchaeia archaeon]|nr:hypothetical protein [Candidatus Nanoarchaeia archaeon]
MKDNIPQTLTRVGIFEDELGSVAGNYSEELTRINVGAKDVKKYGPYSENPGYLIIVSRQADGLLTHPGYNVILTVTSESNETNAQVACEFEQKTGINLREVPKSLERMMQICYEISFLTFKQHGKKAMDILKSL